MSGRVFLEQPMGPSSVARIAFVVPALIVAAVAVHPGAPAPASQPPAPAGESAAPTPHATPDDGLHAEQRGGQPFDPRDLLRRGRGRMDSPAGPHEFYFTRAIYSSGWGGSRWAIDFPKADRQFMTVVNRLIDIDGSPYENAIRLDDPNIRKFPFLYALEVGDIALSRAEIEGLRNYLLAGGFLVIDDFWGSWQWAAFEQQIRAVFPEYPIIDVPIDHPVFNAVYRIDQIMQVPAIGNFYGGRTWEQDGYEAHVRGIFDEKGRLMVLINWNTDLGDAWEWAERPEYPLRFSTFAVEMGINFIVYAMSH